MAVNKCAQKSIAQTLLIQSLKLWQIMFTVSIHSNYKKIPFAHLEEHISTNVHVQRELNQLKPKKLLLETWEREFKIKELGLTLTKNYVFHKECDIQMHKKQVLFYK